MAKHTAMVNSQKQIVNERRPLVVSACEECIEEQVKLTYKEISYRSGIPIKTLQRSPYKDEIAYYKHLDSEDETHNKEIIRLRDKIKHLRSVIAQLNKENHELKTELYYADKI